MATPFEVLPSLRQGKQGKEAQRRSGIDKAQSRENGKTPTLEKQGWGTRRIRV